LTRLLLPPNPAKKPARQACEAADYLTKLPDRIRKLNERAMARKQKQKGTQGAFAWVFDRPVELV
jgi:acyl-[acyl-carrier-protein] desaturase